MVADGDLHTYELGTLIARLFLQRTRRKVHVVACTLHRSRLDANRGLENGANGNAIAGEAWALYHAAIEDATRTKLSLILFSYSTLTQGASQGTGGGAFLSICMARAIRSSGSKSATSCEKCLTCS